MTTFETSISRTFHQAGLDWLLAHATIAVYAAQNRDAIIKEIIDHIVEYGFTSQEATGVARFAVVMAEEHLLIALFTLFFPQTA